LVRTLSELVNAYKTAFRKRRKTVDNTIAASRQANGKFADETDETERS
jgi:hypothetical protein